MKTSEDIMTVDVKVSNALKEYVICVNEGQDIIFPKKGSLLWSLMKLHLDVVPKSYKPVPPSERQDYIRIALHKSRRTKSYNVKQSHRQGQPDLEFMNAWESQQNELRHVDL